MPEMIAPAEDVNYDAYDRETPTAAQVLSTPDRYQHKLPRQEAAGEWFKLAREMRRDPTIALVRQLMIVPALLGPWSIEQSEDSPEDVQQFLTDTLFHHKNWLLRSAMLNCIDFGYAGYEKYFDTDSEGRIYVKHFKSLLADYTDILASADTGQFLGFAQTHPDLGQEVVVEIPEALRHTWDMEGQYWYGQAPLVNARVPYVQWNTANDAADRYDRKIAGAHWVVQYPDGKSTYNGVPNTPNENIAKDILGRLQASGGVALPRRVIEFLEDFETKPASRANNAWDVQLITASGNTAAKFTDRLSYLDKLKVRAFGFPERSILEGNFGTKAEAEAHANFAVSMMEIRHDDFLMDFNQQVVNQQLVLNYGPDKINTAWIVRGPIADSSRDFLQRLYMQMLQNPEGWIAEFDAIDRDTLRDQIQVPTDEEALQEMNDALLRSRQDGSPLRERQRPEMGNGERQGRDSERGSEGGLGDPESR